MPFADHLTPVVSAADPLGRSAARWAGVLTERAGEPVPYAFALAVARQLPAPRKEGPVAPPSARDGAAG